MLLGSISLCRAYLYPQQPPSCSLAAPYLDSIARRIVKLLCRYHMQAAKGDNVSERPMWAEKGGLDFEGRAKWDAWTACKGLKTPKAQLEFVRVRNCTWTDAPAHAYGPSAAHHHQSHQRCEL